MSADNWTLCPKCTKKKVNAVAKVRKLYGTIPLEEFENRLKAANIAEEESRETGETLREDYFQGIRGGVYEVEYYASCDCGFAFTHKYEKKIE